MVSLLFHIAGPSRSILSPFLMYLFVLPTFALGPPSQLCNVFVFPGSYQWYCRNCLSLHLSEMSLAHILERSSVGICLLRVRLVLLLWNSQRILLLWCLPFLVYGETYTCLSIVGLRVVQQVATLDSCENFPLFFGHLRALSRPISCCFISVLLPVLARVHLLVMFLHSMLLFLAQRFTEPPVVSTDPNHLLGHRHPCCWGLGNLAYTMHAGFSWPTLPR